MTKTTYKHNYVIKGDAKSGVGVLQKTTSEVKKFEAAQKKAAAESKRLSRRNKELKQTYASLKSAAGGIVGILSVGVLAREFKNVAVQTDLLMGSLVTMTGSVENASMAFDQLE